MNVTVRGTVPGNSFDASPYVALSAQGDTFNASDAFQFRRTVTVDIHGAQPLGAPPRASPLAALHQRVLTGTPVAPGGFPARCAASEGGGRGGGGGVLTRDSCAPGWRAESASVLLLSKPAGGAGRLP